ncbi:hypothetical protein HII17_03405 [Thalassotalea sp. M1531]|uniref:Uncharacterized protein n=1 Tax=Thalassotalea algicola TaxID=2716224 RepID=A0A7Y0LAD0_9GAMM|nr:hypothetical protein [Thalassotalea algicola]NMP30599.1 hypothetical protein [Thalassotalea algicola]
MDRKSLKFKIIAAIVTIPLFAIFLIGYTFVIFKTSADLSDIKYYSLLGLGLLGIFLWGKMSISTVKEIKSAKV